MGTVIGIVAFVVALLGLLAAGGHIAYLALLNNAAKKRGASGATTIEFVKGRWAVAGGTAAAAVVALLLTTGDIPSDLIGIVLGAGAGLVAKQGLDTTKKQLRGAP